MEGLFSEDFSWLTFSKRPSASLPIYVRIYTKRACLFCWMPYILTIQLFEREILYLQTGADHTGVFTCRLNSLTGAGGLRIAGRICIGDTSISTQEIANILRDLSLVYAANKSFVAQQPMVENYDVSPPSGTHPFCSSSSESDYLLTTSRPVNRQQSPRAVLTNFSFVLDFITCVFGPRPFAELSALYKPSRFRAASPFESLEHYIASSSGAPPRRVLLMLRDGNLLYCPFARSVSKAREQEAPPRRRAKLSSDDSPDAEQHAGKNDGASKHELEREGPAKGKRSLWKGLGKQTRAGAQKEASPKLASAGQHGPGQIQTTSSVLVIPRNVGSLPPDDSEDSIDELFSTDKRESDERQAAGDADKGADARKKTPLFSMGRTSTLSDAYKPLNRQPGNFTTTDASTSEEEHIEIDQIREVAIAQVFQAREQSACGLWGNITARNIMDNLEKR